MKKMFTLFFVLITLLPLVSCGGKLNWPDTKLGNMIPKIDDVRGEVDYESSDSLYIALEEITENQYYDYIEACKAKGFSVDSIEEDGSYAAFNKNGYKIDISYFYSGDMWITVDAPISMSTFDWPNSEIAKLLPKPASNYGKIQWESDHGFAIYVGNTTKDDYKNYVNAVFTLGFTVNYNKGEDYFYADNIDGYSVSLGYEGFNIMLINIDEPNKNSTVIDTENNNTTTSGTTENIPEEITTSHPTTEITTVSNDVTENSSSTAGNTENSSEAVDIIRPEFKEAMDSYEAFFDEYCVFMKNYNSSSDPTSMLNDYLSFMARYAETMSKLNDLGNDELNDAELLYYIEVIARIDQKLLEIVN